MSPRLRRVRCAAPALVAGLLLAVAHLHGHLELLLPVAPLLYLVLSLLVGVYPGCEAVVRLAERIASAGPPKAAAAERACRPKPPFRHAARGGLLLALSRSGRAPPARA